MSPLYNASARAGVKKGSSSTTGGCMTKIVTDFPLFSCLVAFVCGIVLAAATFLI